MKKILISLLAALTVGTSSVSTFAIWQNDQPLPEQNAFQRVQYFEINEYNGNFDQILLGIGCNAILAKLHHMREQEVFPGGYYQFDNLQMTFINRIDYLIYVCEFWRDNQQTTAQNLRLILQEIARLYRSNEVVLDLNLHNKLIIIFDAENMPHRPVRIGNRIDRNQLDQVPFPSFDEQN